jgi:hypothetical protein
MNLCDQETIIQNSEIKCIPSGFHMGHFFNTFHSVIFPVFSTRDARTFISTKKHSLFSAHSINILQLTFLMRYIHSWSAINSSSQHRILPTPKGEDATHLFTNSCQSCECLHKQLACKMLLLHYISNICAFRQNILSQTLSISYFIL